jgi:hypothetical protein
MPDADEKLRHADPRDVRIALALALGTKRPPHIHEVLANNVAEHLVRELERSGFVVMKRPQAGPGPAGGRGSEGEPCASFASRMTASLYDSPRRRSAARRFASASVSQSRYWPLALRSGG